jgi:hypothetical protein
MLFLLAACLQAPAVEAKPPITTPITTPAATETTIRRAVGPHFAVEVHFDSQLAADQALAAAEWTVAPIESIYGKLPAGSDTQHAHPPRIVLYATDAEYTSAVLKGEDAASRARPKNGPIVCSWGPVTPDLSRPAFHEHDSRASDVLTDPTFTLDRLKTLGLPMQTRLVVATEAAHLLADELRPDWHADAPWFSDGAAQWAAEEAFAAAGWVHDRMEEPVFATQAQIVRALVDLDSIPWLESITTGLPAGLTGAERLAVDGAIFRFLKDPSRADVYARVASAAQRFQPGDQPDAGLRLALGDEAARAALEQAFAKYARALDPKWIETVPALTTSGTSSLQVAAADRNAIAWRTEPAGSAHYALEGEFEILPGPKQQMNVLLAGVDDHFVQVSFVAGYGIDVFRFDKKVDVVDHHITSDEDWTKLATIAVKGLETGRSIPFRLEVDGAKLSVSIAGKPALAVPIQARTAGGRWGLGVLAGSAGRWRNLGFGRL